MQDWVENGFRWIGEKEKPGPEANNFITDCLDTTTLPPNMKNSDETAWCAAFVNKMMLDSGIDGTGSALARRWLHWGWGCGPVVGSVCVLWRKARTSKFGHVGFLIRQTAGMVYLLGGNQANAVSISTYPIGRVLSYRWPRKKHL